MARKHLGNSSVLISHLEKVGSFAEDTLKKEWSKSVQQRLRYSDLNPSMSQKKEDPLFPMMQLDSVFH